MLTQEQIESLSDIPTATVQMDIADTEREIEALEAKIIYLEKEIAAQGLGTPQARMAAFRLDGARSGIQKRKKFVAKLNYLLDARKG